MQAVTSFGLSQILGVAAQKAITDMRRRVEEHVMRLPVRYFDTTQTGVLISRVMNDAEGIRNLVGTGLVQLTGSIVTAVLALGVLLYLNWHLTLVTILVLAAFGGAMSYAFRTLRPLFRERGQDPGRSDRPAEPGARRRARRQDLHRRAARGPRLHQGRAPAASGTSRSR